MSCIRVFLQAQQGLTSFTFPAACSLPLKTRWHQQAPYTKTGVHTRSQLQPPRLSMCVLPAGPEGKLTPRFSLCGSAATAEQTTYREPAPHGACLRSCRLRFLQTVCVYIRSIWTTCNWTLLVFLHNSIPLEPHNILLIALGLETYFASKKAAMDLSFACFCWCSCFRDRSFRLAALLDPRFWRNIPASFEA